MNPKVEIALWIVAFFGLILAFLFIVTSVPRSDIAIKPNQGGHIEEIPVRTLPPSTSLSDSIITEGFHKVNTGGATLGMDMRVINAVESEEECKNLCDEESGFDCRVYEFHKEYGVCSIGTQSKLDFLTSMDTGTPYVTFNADMDTDSEFDGFAKLTECTPIHKNGVVKSSRDNVMNLSSCHTSCMLDSNCNSFTWNKNTQTCIHYPHKISKNSVDPAFGSDCYIRR